MIWEPILEAALEKVNSFPCTSEGIVLSAGLSDSPRDSQSTCLFVLLACGAVDYP